jgi:hypothetical protein
MKSMKRNTYTFTVKIGDWSAVIETHSDHSLYELAEAILSAAKFENDHAFGFYEPDYFKPGLRGRVDRSGFEQYTLFADMDEGDAEAHDPGVQGTPVGEVFEVGVPYVFLFDYGDDWRFDLVCTNIAMGTKLRKKTAILSTTGEPPEQYPDYEE